MIVDISDYFSKLGKKGGSVKSDKKRKSGQRNTEKARAKLAEIREKRKQDKLSGITDSFTNT